MKKYAIGLSALLLLAGCQTEGVEKEQPEEQLQEDSPEEVNVLDTDHEVSDHLKLDNGIVIKWFEHGSGENIAQGECVDIDYKVQLENGEVVDGNHLLKKKSMPFIVGFGMQTPGWDIALRQLKVGDFAEIYIPSELARGKKGIRDLIPPDADNVLRIRILERNKPDREVDGNKVWIFESNETNTLGFDENSIITFHCMVSTPSNPRYVNTFADNNPFELRLEDNGLVPGLKKALINAKKSDRMYILVPSREAYADKGYMDVVKPGEDILYNVLVMDVRRK